MSVGNLQSHLSNDLNDLSHLDLQDKVSAKEKFFRKYILQLKNFIEIHSSRARIVYKQVDKCFELNLKIELIFNKVLL